MTECIPHSAPYIGDDEIDAVVACLRTGWIKGGARRAALEERVASDVGYARGVATTSGSQALHLLLRCHFGVAGGTVALPSYVCRSVYDAILLAGCRPIVVDMDPATCSIDVDATISAAPDAVLVPHMFGIRAPIEQLTDAGMIVIEDCAARLAPTDRASAEPRGTYRIMSFEVTKLLTCGEGGLILGDDVGVMERCRAQRDGGYEHPEPAAWLPLTDFQAAMALVQWGRLDSFLARRSAIATRYETAIDRIRAGVIHPAMYLDDTWHFRYVLELDDVDGFISLLAADGVTARRPVAPAALHEQYDVRGDFHHTVRAMDRYVSLPIYPSLSDADVERVVRAVTRALERSE